MKINALTLLGVLCLCQLPSGYSEATQTNSFQLAKAAVCQHLNETRGSVVGGCPNGLTYLGPHEEPNVISFQADTLVPNYSRQRHGANRFWRAYVYFDLNSGRVDSEGCAIPKTDIEGC